MPGKILESEFALGRQLTLEYHDCGPETLLQTETVEAALLKAAEESGATIISSSFHRFSPQGVSGVVIIAESHFTIHAWPEHNYAAVDIFTCGQNIDIDRAIRSMEVSFCAGRVRVSSDLNRGILNRDSRPDPDGMVLPGKNNALVPVSWKEVWTQQMPRGVLASVDLYECDEGRISDPDRIKTFAASLGDRLRAEPRGNCRISDLGRPGGIDISQAMTTGQVSGRFLPWDRVAYLDLLFFAFYDPREAAEFALGFFRGDHYKIQMTLRA